MTSKATVDVTSTVTSTQTINTMTITISTIQATQTVTGDPNRCNYYGQCGIDCFTDHDTDGNTICAAAFEVLRTTCTSNSDCPNRFHCSVGASCAFQTKSRSDPLICLRALGSCGTSIKRENALYDTDTRTGKIIRASDFKNGFKHSQS